LGILKNQMTNLKIAWLWLVTVFLGSWVFPLFNMLRIEPNLEDTLGLFIYFFTISLLTSSPALFAFLLGNDHYSEKYTDNNVYKSKMFRLHIWVGLVYFFGGIVLGILSNPFLFLALIIVICYLPIGLLLWHFQFRNKAIDKE
jgi:hypothetical protein